MNLIDEYEKTYNENLCNNEEEYLDKINKPYKVSGNIFSYFLREKILGIIDNKYELSVVNSYIKGCNVEWDLLMVNNASENEKKYNIYLPEHVVCAFEFKTSGSSRSKEPNEAIEYLEKEINDIKLVNKNYKTNIKYFYISLCENPNHAIAMRKKYPNNCFWIIDDYYSRRYKKHSSEESELKDFILNNLKDNK